MSMLPYTDEHPTPALENTRKKINGVLYEGRRGGWFPVDVTDTGLNVVDAARTAVAFRKTDDFDEAMRRLEVAIQAHDEKGRKP